MNFPEKKPVPGISLTALSFPFIHKRFVKGYADGKTITQIFYGKPTAKKDR